eukprot:214726-Pleurochrysis_carterae.AAC.1
MSVGRRPQRTRGIDRELNVLGTERASLVGGVECDRGAARLLKKRGADVGDSWISSGGEGTVAGVGGGLRIEFLDALSAVPMPMLAAAVPTRSETRRPSFVKSVRPF